MDLDKVLAAAGRHKMIIALGVLLGLALGFLSMFRVVPAGAGGGDGMGLQRRSGATYQAETALLIDTPGFGMGRADIVNRRTDELAGVYSYLASSDPVMRTVKEQIGPIDVQVTSEQVERTPVVKVITMGSDEKRVRQVADATSRAFVAYLEDVQESNHIPPDQRMVVLYINRPKVTQQKSRQAEMALLAAMLPIVGSIGLAFVVENAKLRFIREPVEPEPEEPEPEEPDEQFEFGSGIPTPRNEE